MCAWGGGGGGGIGTILFTRTGKCFNCSTRLLALVGGGGGGVLYSSVQQYSDKCFYCNTRLLGGGGGGRGLYSSVHQYSDKCFYCNTRLLGQGGGGGALYCSFPPVLWQVLLLQYQAGEGVGLCTVPSPQYSDKCFCCNTRLGRGWGSVLFLPPNTLTSAFAAIPGWGGGGALYCSFPPILWQVLLLQYQAGEGVGLCTVPSPQYSDRCFCCTARLFVEEKGSVEGSVLFRAPVMMMMSWCLMSSDVIWHIRDKLWPMPKHSSIKSTYVRCMRV